MVKVASFHSKLASADAYHDNDSCKTGNNIETYNRVSGTGGFPRCQECARLN